MTDADLLRENGQLRKRVEELVRMANRLISERSEANKALFLEVERNARNDALHEAATLAAAFAATVPYDGSDLATVQLHGVAPSILNLKTTEAKP